MESVKSRREVTVAFVLCAAGAGLALWAATQPWGTQLVERVAPLPVISKTVSGRDAALALVGLAGALALLALKRIGRTVLGAFVALCGLGMVVDAISGLTGPALRPTTTSMTVSVTLIWGVLAVVGGVLVLLGGLLVAIRARTWSVPERYELPSADHKVTAGVSSDAETWDAMDRGEDPTRG
jgi:uncharacterized membrane protein (TIGR02234 family)